MHKRWISAGTYASLLATAVLCVVVLLCGTHGMPAMAHDCPLVTAPALCPMASISGLASWELFVSSPKVIAWAVASLIALWLLSLGLGTSPVRPYLFRPRSHLYPVPGPTWFPLAEAFADGRIQPLLYA